MTTLPFEPVQREEGPHVHAVRQELGDATRSFSTTMERYAALIGCAQNDASTQADIAAPGCDASTATDGSTATNGSDASSTEAEAERGTETGTEKTRLLEQLQEQEHTLAAERASHAATQAQLAFVDP